MKYKKYLWIAGMLLFIVVAYAFFRGSKETELAITTVVKKGDFLDEVIISGEAQSTSLKKINGPDAVRKFKLRDIKIQDLITEGTIVKKGDYIGKLDPSGVNEMIIDARLNLETCQSKYIQQQIDTTLTLKQERSAIKDLRFGIEQNELELKQSIYEPPATIRKLEIDLEKGTRDLRERLENYSIKKRRAIAKMVEVGTEVLKIKKRLTALQELQNSFTIYSDASGMITYAKTWNGSKKKVGSTINMWDLTIATLPDLTKMESKTYANEVDIRKIKKGLIVSVGFDAFPEINLEGVVTSVANVGENKRGSDIKIFQVSILIKEIHESIKPGMTTSNRILIQKQEDVLIIPLEAVFSKDSISFSYVKTGFSIQKKQLELGDANLDQVIVKRGLNVDQVIYLNEPEGYENKQIQLLKKEDDR